MTVNRKSLGKRSRQKGNAFELEIIKNLKEIGFINCVSARSESKLIDNDKIDVVDLDKKLPINIQSKYTLNTPNYFTIASQCSDKSKPFVIIWKKTGEKGHHSPGTLALIPDKFFYELLKVYYEATKNKEMVG